MSTHISRRATAGLATTGALLLGALAAAPQAGAQPVYVCQKVGGTFHVVTSKQKCKKGESKLSLGVSESGAMGVVGATGPAGVAGSAGAPGAAGPAGAVGAVGAVGATGPAGAPGAAANAGATGAKGVTGEAGLKGVTGSTGVTGPTGPAGGTGPTGTVGTVEKGEKTASVAFGALGALATVEATCKVAGELPMSGGYTSELVGVTPIHSLRTTNGWEVQFANESAVEKPSNETVYVYCLKAK